MTVSMRSAWGPLELQFAEQKMEAPRPFRAAMIAPVSICSRGATHCSIFSEAGLVIATTAYSCCAHVAAASGGRMETTSSFVGCQRTAPARGRRPWGSRSSGSVLRLERVGSTDAASRRSFSYSAQRSFFVSLSARFFKIASKLHERSVLRRAADVLRASPVLINGRLRHSTRRA